WCSAGVKFTGTQVIEATSEAALQRSATFLSQDISNTAQALTTLLSVSRALPQALAHRMGDLELKPQEPANTAQAPGKLSFEHSMPELRDSFQASISEANAQDTSSFAWAPGATAVHGTPLQSALAAEAATKMALSGPQDASNMLRRFATLECNE
ncbi:unnamed protein product, partial [Symbiodinium necroappetens]